MSKSDPYDDMFEATHKNGKASWESEDEEEDLFQDLEEEDLDKLFT